MIRRVSMAVLLLSVSLTRAADLSGVACPDSGLLGPQMLSSVCWSCFFPIRIGGVPTGGRVDRVPDGAASPSCVCPGRTLGIPTPGVTAGMWQPTHVIETVRHPYCSVALGTRFSGSPSVQDLSLLGGNDSNGGDGEAAYYNFHLFTFPLGVILDLLQDVYCVSDAGVDMDLAYISELDPTWNNSELALFMAPETVLFANPIAIAACVAEAAQLGVGGPPIASLFWCAGAWGLAYPHSGHIPTGDSVVRSTSAAAARALGLVHRRGIMTKTMGDSAVCRDHPWPMLPKTQYRLSTAYPIPEVLDNHWLGEPTLRWGTGRTIPGVGEDFAFVVWSWQDCCINY